jgi:purine-binding chemotaxis protein CheW
MPDNSSDYRNKPTAANEPSERTPPVGGGSPDSRFDIGAMLQELREDFKRGLYTEDEATAEETARPGIEVLTIHLADQSYALETRFIVEIVKAPRIVPVPGAPSFILGIINLRGEIVSVINIKEFIKPTELPETAADWVVIVKDGAVSTGVRVDTVGRIMQLPASQLKPPPAAAPGARAELISGQFKIDDSLLILLSVPSIVSCRELNVS